MNGTKQLRILVAEDDPVNALVASKLLEKAGATVVTVNNGQLAVEEFYKTSYDLILMDISMPVMDGMEAVKQIRQHEKGKRTDPVPVVALTAYGSESDRTRTMNAGFDHHLVKPVSFEVLKDTIDRFFYK